MKYTVRPSAPTDVVGTVQKSGQQAVRANE